ncbi:metallophosphoesterase [Gottfriedia sp. NPDC056225]|uniref:metallophosphoesterase n=1 Tax=Gottfriedia sp. NPDC056225 TaxID=3345751 RepID=UPI0035D8CDB2
MKKILNIIITTVMLGFFGFSIWYIAYQTHSLINFSSYWMIQAIVAIGFIGSMVVIGLSVKSSNRIVSALNVIGGYIITFFAYLFILLVILNLIQLIWNLPLIESGITVLTLALIVTVVSSLMGSSFVVKESNIQITGLKKELSIMHITDVHLGHHRGKEYLVRIVKETNERKPDLVLITGDLVDAETALQPGVLNPLSTFNAPAYFIEGNHEKYVGSDKSLKLIKQQGVRILHNEVIETHDLQIIGLDYMNADEKAFDMHPSDNTNTIKSVLANLSINREIPSILMHHSPVGAKYADEAGIDLMLSGHTHAGQIFPFTLLSELIFPYNRGSHEHGKTKVVVSEGAGTYMLRGRLGSSNQINLLHLVPK